MSKFLKFIVHFVVICTIACVLALALPPFFGVTTEIRDDSSAESNLPVGSVTYAIPVKTAEVSVGTPILVQDEGNVYRYNIVSLDLEKHTGVVIDPSAPSPESINVAVKNYVPKVVITIGYLGYLMLATESIEGLVVIGLAVLFLIILYVIAELWRKEPEDEYDEVEVDPSYIKSEKELRQEEKLREKRMREEDKELLRNEKLRKKQEKKQKKIIKTGGFVDEVYEEDVYEEEYETEEVQRPEEVLAATSEAHELLKKEVAAATAEEQYEEYEEEYEEPVKVAAPVKKKAKKQVVRKEAPAPVEAPAETIKMAIPVLTAAQLADRAKKEGDAPEIIRDAVTKVTLFDYSDIIGGESEEYYDE